MSGQWTSRGTGKCPECNGIYRTAWKPKYCQSCNFELGGTHNPKPKRKKLNNPLVVRIHGNVYSVRTSPRGERCFVISDEKSKVCHYHKCVPARGIQVASLRPVENFSCPHLDMVNSVSPALHCWKLDETNVQNYKCDDETRRHLRYLIEQAFPSVIQVAEKMYAVCGRPSPSSPIGFVHMCKDGSSHKCLSADCKSQYVGKTKQIKTKKLCMHIHVFLCTMKSGITDATDAPSTSSIPDATPDAPSTSSIPDATPPMSSTTTYSSKLMEDSTVKLKCSMSVPYPVPEAYMMEAQRRDAATILQCQEGRWPSEFQPPEQSCKLCDGPLSTSKIHPGSDGKCFIMTNANPFLACKIYVKSCKNTECRAITQVVPHTIGLFNVCDKVLISFEVLIEWREAIKRGVPVMTAIDAKISAWKAKTRKECQPLSSTIQNICRLLYNGFYCFEMVSERSLDNVICGYCGIIGECYLGDGNQKNCCSVAGIDYSDDEEEDEEGEEGDLPSLEQFLSNIKKMWVSRATFSSTNGLDNVKISIGKIPPIIAPTLRGEKVYNTEKKKKSIYLKKRKNKDIKGDSALLHKIIQQEKITMSELDALTIDDLKRICTFCKLGCPASCSKSWLISELTALYEYVLIGNSPCHGFTKVPGHTGGFYHFVCRHGCTVGSKFLLLQESVRDAADIYMSLRYPPPLFICDTPCGFARHMDLQHPSLSRTLWGDRVGCFEKPELEKSPKQVSIPELAPLDVRDRNVALPPPNQLSGSEHPITRSRERYVAQDRFHASSEPHKSPLCVYHDINNWKQACSIKTSQQESENHRKNQLRLRSSTQQSFPVHFTYNFLMDFYQNEKVVQQQREELIAMGKALGETERDDIYKRFVFA